MIDAVGYTEDRQVFVRMLLTVNDEPMSGMLTMKPEAARKFAHDLVDAADQLEALCQKPPEP